MTAPPTPPSDEDCPFPPLSASCRLSMQEVAEAAALKAVRATFLQLGIDPGQPLRAQRDMAALAELREMLDDREWQRDFAFLRKSRRWFDGITGKALGAFLVLSVLGMVAFALLALGFEVMSGHGL